MKSFSVDLGNEEINAKFNALKNSMSQQYSTVSLLRWNGSKIPRGAKVGGMNIDWTQHGMVSAGGKTVGMYDRLVEYGDNELQVMVLYTNEPVTDTQGNPCPTR